MENAKKQKWFDGPSMPIKGCVLDACGVPLNQTDVLIFVGPLKHSKYYWGKAVNDKV